MAADYTWEGSHVFRMNGTAVNEDTLRVNARKSKIEKTLRLVLPTLCITYADMKFQNAIGGEQRTYPDSKAYGPEFFGSPVRIHGEKEIERLTYIRGAEEVEIGEVNTIIEFSSLKELVIPRLRLSKEKPAEAEIFVPKTRIEVTYPLKIDIAHYADGRLVGGLRVEKRHPDWKPSEVPQIYEAWVHVVEGLTGRPVPKVEVDLWHWNPKAGVLDMSTRKFTDSNGHVKAAERPSGELEAFVVRLPGHRSVVRCLRPLAGQNVRMTMNVWPLRRTLVPYLWGKTDTLDRIAFLGGHAVDTVLELNRMIKPDIEPGLRMILPCFAGTYRLESWDSLDWVGKIFGYTDAKGLARVNDVESLTGGEEIQLPDWFYVYAPENRTLEDIDVMFGLPKGSSMPVGRVYHPDPQIPFVGEMIAVHMAGVSYRTQENEEK